MIKVGQIRLTESAFPFGRVARNLCHIFACQLILRGERVPVAGPLFSPAGSSAKEKCRQSVGIGTASNAFCNFFCLAKALHIALLKGLEVKLLVCHTE